MRTRGRGRRTTTSLVGLGLWLAIRPAVAGEPGEGSPSAPPRVMMEPGEVVEVVDSFDDDDPFDISISLGFQYTAKEARILRESSLNQPGLTTGGYTASTMNVAEYAEQISRLVPGLDLGLYKDFAFHFRVPIVLSSARRLDALGGNEGLLPFVLAGAPGETLFALPFVSPERSGPEYLAMGLNLDIFNQARDHTKPTWLLGAEVRLGVGEPLHPCNSAPPAGQVECADPGDVNRNGESDINDPSLKGAGGPLEAASLKERGAGYTRGMVGLEAHTLMSKRIKYVEPYGGFAALFDFPLLNADYDITDVQGALVNAPPIVGTVTVGMMVHPWENREKFGRLTFNLRFDGEYHSAGRDGSELFDALGSSSARSLRDPKWASYKDNCPENPKAACPCQGTTCPPKSVVDTGSQKVYFTGLTLVEAYGSYRARASVSWQANEYFKINAGGGLRFEQAHGITHEQACNPNFKSDIGASGPCHTGDPMKTEISATGIPNPNYRPSIDAVGRRFYVDESRTFEVFANGVLMF
ncbi:MAG: hypothetical protein HY744_31555 [Deltaproteobacteria bacterium]|nr:hypothetical protein [Deltaproteobacteria bacterium]